MQMSSARSHAIPPRLLLAAVFCLVLFGAIAPAQATNSSEGIGRPSKVLGLATPTGLALAGFDCVSHLTGPPQWSCGNEVDDGNIVLEWSFAANPCEGLDCPTATGFKVYGSTTRDGIYQEVASQSGPTQTAVALRQHLGDLYLKVGPCFEVRAVTGLGVVGPASAPLCLPIPPLNLKILHLQNIHTEESGPTAGCTLYPWNSGPLPQGEVLVGFRDNLYINCNGPNTYDINDYQLGLQFDISELKGKSFKTATLSMNTTGGVFSFYSATGPQLEERRELISCAVNVGSAINLDWMTDSNIFVQYKLFKKIPLPQNAYTIYPVTPKAFSPDVTGMLHEWLDHANNGVILSGSETPDSRDFNECVSAYDNITLTVTF